MGAATALASVRSRAELVRSDYVSKSGATFWEFRRVVFPDVAQPVKAKKACTNRMEEVEVDTEKK